LVERTTVASRRDPPRLSVESPAVAIDAGLVEREQRGSWAYFRIIGDPLADLRSLLA
jgi:hypothetical protein